MVPFLKGHQLFQHVDGSTEMPPLMVDGAENPAHAKWVMVDQLILSA